MSNEDKELVTYIIQRFNEDGTITVYQVIASPLTLEDLESLREAS